jgi:hypothetical protein
MVMTMASKGSSAPKAAKTGPEPVPHEGTLMHILPGEVRPDHEGGSGSPGLDHLKPPVPEASAPPADRDGG